MFIATKSLLFCLFALLQTSRGAENRTIDDSFGDSVTGLKPEFTPSSAWNVGVCSRCVIKPEGARSFRGTWTEATYRPTEALKIRMSFQGTAIYVFFTLADYAGGAITTPTRCKFQLDSSAAVPYEFVSEVTGPQSLLYNQLVFSRTNLTSGNHVLEIIADGDQQSYINFDYAIYTYEDEEGNTSASSSGLQNSTSLVDSSTRSQPATPTSSSFSTSSSDIASESDVPNGDESSDNTSSGMTKGSLGWGTIVNSILCGLTALAIAGYVA